MFYFNSEDYPQGLPQPQTVGPITVYTGPVAPPSPLLTVLTAAPDPSTQQHPKLTKTFYVDDSGKVIKQDFQNPVLFNVSRRYIDNLESLAQHITEISQDPHSVIIRGIPHQRFQAPVTRRLENFDEHPEGTPWVMLDFDNITTAADPLSESAIEELIWKLPAEFHQASYFYQHSSSAGILDSEGIPLKSGANVHLFFWLDRRIPGKWLSAYLEKHCLEQDHYQIVENGHVRVKTIIDPSVITNAVQPHYIVPPVIASDVRCLLSPATRQNLVIKPKPAVSCPDLQAEIVGLASRLKQQIKVKYQKANGYIGNASITRTTDGIATTMFYSKPSTGSKSGRSLSNVKLDVAGEFLTLYFEDEHSPGSWYVAKKSPTIARHFGGDWAPLKEICPEAYQYVQTALKWFTEVAHQHLALQGSYLPPIQEFAKAQVSLILAPTGSGKTRATIDWVRSLRNGTCIVIYVAPTIALVNQMNADMEQAGIRWVSYRDVWAGNIIDTQVIITTLKSFSKIMNLVYEAGLQHYLIFDEIHATLGELMSSNRSEELFEHALLKAKQTLLMTGTLTDVQKNTIPGIVGHALSSLDSTKYCCYEFASTKRNPLSLHPSQKFGGDFIQLLDEFAEQIKQGSIPLRIVILISTSRMKAFKLLLEKRELDQYACIVSRPENTQTEIDEARISNRPILIASPLFGVGINLEHEPDILWACFDRLQVDTNHIIQTVNRANRGSKQCEVRIYGTPKLNTTFRLPSRTKLHVEVAARFRNEASIAGIWEEHFHIDRNTYNVLRSLERNTGISLGQLLEHDSIQNYTICLDDVVSTESKSTELAEAKKEARIAYANAVAQQSYRHTGLEFPEWFMRLDRLREERRTTHFQVQPRTGREIENEERGLIMILCQCTPQLAAKVRIDKLQRLFGEKIPFLSSQYQPDIFLHWATVVTEKSEYLLELLIKLNELRKGNLDINNMVNSLTRNKALISAFLALSNHDNEYLAIHTKLEAFRNARLNAKAKASKAQREKLFANGLKLLTYLLEPLGIFFERNAVDGRIRVNYGQLIVPADWNLPVMITTMYLQIQRMKALPLEQKQPIVGEDMYSARPEMSLDVCKHCVFYYQSSCVQGHPVDWQDSLLPQQKETNCSSFKGIKIRQTH